TQAEVTARQTAGEICAGPEMSCLLFPTAAMVAVLAANRSDFVTGEKLEPIYLRATGFVKAPAGRLIH
ncbi:MAG TPA: hypothetical protein VMA13_10420, partial [Candidatus Saccharimonadales bacterium]|nr:hypothetical protein [Candidatus Saccharimonadales bacterium]